MKRKGFLPLSRKGTASLWTEQKSQNCVRKSLPLCGDKLRHFCLWSDGLWIHVAEWGSHSESVYLHHHTRSHRNQPFCNSVTRSGCESEEQDKNVLGLLFLKKRSCQISKHTNCTLISSRTMDWFQSKVWGRHEVCSLKSVHPCQSRVLLLHRFSFFSATARICEEKDIKARKSEDMPRGVH